MSKIVLNRCISCFLILCIVLSASFAGFPGQASAQSSNALNNVPELLITELVPDSTNVGTADGYEFIEVYNNTDQDIDFSHYKIRYRYLESDTLWAHVPDEVMIPSRGTLVFWIINAQNSKSTIADFNKNYGTNLIENTDVVKIFSGGMSNSRMRELVVVTNTGRPIVSAFYNDGDVHNAADQGIFYKYPEDGSLKMQRISQLEHKATPGSLQHSEVPAEPVHIDVTKEPTVTNRTTTTNVTPGENLEILAEAHDDRMVTSLALSYRVDGQNDYKVVQLQEGKQGLGHTISYLELLGHTKLEYFFTVSNTFKEVASPKYEVDLTGNGASASLNVDDQQTVTGITYIRGAAGGGEPADLKLHIDGQPVQGTPVMEHSAYFVFEGDGIDDGINTVTIGKNVLFKTEANIDGYQTIVVPIEPQWLISGINEITLRAGDNEKTYFEDDKPTGNMDDFNARNVRLLLGDGTEIRDPQFSDPALIHDLGDDGRFLPFVAFQFDIPADKVKALSYAWDTTTVTDGQHKVELNVKGKSEASAIVQVDNNGPVISVTVEEGKSYKGSIPIDVTAEDSVSGVEQVKVLLDGRTIQVPYDTSSSELDPGDHKLEIRAVDKIGNISKRTVTFNTAPEHPNAPVLVSQADMESGTGLSPELKVQVSDPSDDELEVSFHQAYPYHALSGDRVKLSKNASDEEPPKDRFPVGETALTAEELKLVAESNDQYVTVDSTSQFPYIRFEVELEHAVEPGDSVEVTWEGHTVPGRKVTMYAWNHNQNKWTEITKHIAQSEDDFTLRGELMAADYVQNSKVDVIVQDEIPSRGDYDYTFVWVSDTQFLTELYPHIQQKQFDWIVDSIDDMNIKYLFHTGDIVNDPTAEYQWKRADDYMKMLEDANLPHGVLAGNHDVGSYDWDYTTYSQYFGEERYKNQPYYGGSYKDNRGHYDLVSVEGNDFIMMYMGWGVEDEDIKWMNEVLAAYPDRTTFLNFHDYMLANGTRSGIGNKLYKEVVVPNPNVVAVLSGHYTGASLLKNELDDNGDGIADRTVYQMLADYQGHADGGSGYLRLLHFDKDSNQIYVNTYSPYLDKYNYYTNGSDEFKMNLDLEPKLKRVATDSIQVNHLRGESIGTPQNVASGTEVAQPWTGLQSDGTYSWYVVAQDKFGGKALSDVWTFTTDGGNLNAPTNLKALNVTSSTVQIGWDPVNSPDQQVVNFNVYQDGERVATVTDSVYEATGLTPDTLYEFKVTAVDKQGTESTPSEALTVITQAVEIPGAPVWTAGELEFSDITSNGVSMSWPEATADHGVDGYRVYLKGRSEPVVAVTNDVYSHTASGLEPDTRYHFTVKAYNAAGESAGLHNTVTTPAAAVDKSELIGLIASAQQRLDETREGTSPGQYPVAARSALRAAIERASAIAQQDHATAKTVQDAIIALQAAIRTYNASVVPSTENPPSSGSESGSGSSGGYVLSGDNRLKELEVIIGDKAAELTPAFNENRTEYRLETEAESVQLRVHAAHSKATVLLGEEPLKKDQVIELKEGDNLLKLVIRAENGTTRTYQLTIHRKAKPGTEEPKPEPKPVMLTDIAGHWASSAIEEAVQLGIVGGYPDHTFKPDRQVTRAEFMVMMAKALDGQRDAGKLDFKDSSQIGSWALEAIQWAVSEGIVKGYEDGSFRSNQSVNRSEMAVMIARYLGLALPEAETEFRDQQAIPAWAEKEIAAATAAGIVNGRSGNRFAPRDSATRAEAVMMILRMLENVEKQ
ncbi:S-layer homology domain-containing protein [Paenibacillus lautus]|uniref:S-layer homology domain-containing protein n=1 Tax=Paenibacillus lautus TaxID=1401 RepID=UPI003D276EE5